MQQWFTEEKCCDMTIEIAIAAEEEKDDDTADSPLEPRPKKMKIAAAAAKKDDANRVEIKAHSLALGARSDYIRYVSIWQFACFASWTLRCLYVQWLIPFSLSPSGLLSLIILLLHQCLYHQWV